MSIIHKYIIKEITRYVLIVIVLVSSIFVLNDFLGAVGKFMDAGIPMTQGVLYVFLRVPFFISTILPVSIILSVLIVYGIMQKNKEMVAIKSGGVSTMYINTAALIAGLIFTLVLYFTAEVLAPMSLIEADKIRPRYENVTYNWIKSKDSITHVRYYDPSSNKISGLSVYYFDRDFKIKKRVDAKSSVYEGKENKWKLHHVMIQEREDNGDLRETFHEAVSYTLPVEPGNLKNVVRKNRALSSVDLKKMIKRMESEGYDAVGYKVDYYGKLAMPFVCIIMVLVATVITTFEKIGKSIPISIVCGLVLWFIHWSLHSLFLSLGKGEVLPPIVAAWLANFIFFTCGSYLVVKRSEWV